MKRRAAGFTLLELLVAIGLMALLSVLGYRGLDSLLRSRDDLGRRDEALALLAQTWTWLERDISALPPESTVTGSIPRLALTRDEREQPVLALTTAPATGAADGRRVARTVTYRLSDGSLERRERPAGAADTAGGSDATPPLPLAPATAWQAESWVDGRGWTAGESAPVARPVALRVSLTVSGSTYVRLFTLRP